MNQSNIPPDNQSDEISLWDLIAATKSGWLWIIGGALLGLVVGLGIIFLVPAKYEASVLIKPATVGILGSNSNSNSNSNLVGVDVESAPQLMERLKLPNFYKPQIQQACAVDSMSAPGRYLANGLKSTAAVKNLSMVKLEYRASSPELAATCLSAIVNELAAVQTQMAAPLIANLEEQKKITKQQLDATKAFEAKILAGASATTAKENQTQNVLLLNAAQANHETSLKLRKLYIDQTVQLSPPLTQALQLIEPIYSPSQPVFPKRMLTIAIALVVGLFAGILGFFTHRGWQNYAREQVR